MREKGVVLFAAGSRLRVCAVQQDTLIRLNLDNLPHPTPVVSRHFKTTVMN